MDNKLHNILENLCVNDNSRVESIRHKLLKKMSYKSSIDLRNLRDLFYWLFIYNYNQELRSLYIIGLSLKFTGNWNLWTPCEHILSLIYYLSANITGQEEYKREALEKIFSAYESRDTLDRRCEGLFIEKRQAKVRIAILSNRKASIQDALYLELLELIEIYAFGGSKKYSLDRIVKRVDEIKQQLQFL